MKSLSVTIQMKANSSSTFLWYCLFSCTRWFGLLRLAQMCTSDEAIVNNSLVCCGCFSSAVPGHAISAALSSPVFRFSPRETLRGKERARANFPGQQLVIEPLVAGGDVRARSRSRCSTRKIR